MYFISTSVEETYKIAHNFTQSLQGTEVICLSGEIGAGKTHFIKGMAAYYGIPTQEIISPTFVLRRDYCSTKGGLFHFDLYRLDEITDEVLETIGLLDVIKEGIVLVEWGERAKEKIAFDRIIRMQYMDEKTRSIVVQ